MSIAMRVAHAARFKNQIAALPITNATGLKFPMPYHLRTTCYDIVEEQNTAQITIDLGSISNYTHDIFLKLEIDEGLSSFMR